MYIRCNIHLEYQCLIAIRWDSLKICFIVSISLKTAWFVILLQYNCQLLYKIHGYSIGLGMFIFFVVEYRINLVGIHFNFQLVFFCGLRLIHAIQNCFSVLNLISKQSHFHSFLIAQPLSCFCALTKKNTGSNTYCNTFSYYAQSCNDTTLSDCQNDESNVS